MLSDKICLNLKTTGDWNLTSKEKKGEKGGRIICGDPSTKEFPWIYPVVSLGTSGLIIGHVIEQEVLIPLILLLTFV